MTTNDSPGVVPDKSKDATKMTRADWEKAVAEEKKAQQPDLDKLGKGDGDKPADDFDTRFEKAMAAERAKHEKEMQATLARVPQLDVPAHSGGPGNDNHQRSWSLADQEAAMRGDTLDHWEMP